MADANPFGIPTTRRFVSPGGENLLYRPGEVRQHGRIELVDYMGGDSTVESVATAGHGRKIFPENPEPRDFINHLARSGIYEPFTSVQLKLLIQAPISVALAFVYAPRCSVNEYSGRYSVMLDTSEVPTVEEVQASLRGGNTQERAKKIVAAFNANRARAQKGYNALVGLDLTRELARLGLGIDNDTRFYWKMDLPSLADFVGKYRKSTTPREPLRAYIETVAEIAMQVAPLAWRALMNRSGKSNLELTLPTDDCVVDSPLSPADWSPAQTRRVTVPALEKMLFVSRRILDHGEVQAVNYMGDDNSLAEAARTSYGEGTKSLQSNAVLVNSLVRDAHTSPIEMAELAFEVKAPVFSDPRQIGRHRTLDRHGFMGYTPVGDTFYLPPDKELKYQDRRNRQGRGKRMSPEHKANAAKILESTLKSEARTAHRLRRMGAPESLVRESKGVGFYTVQWHTGDAHNIGHFLRLRLAPDAQLETREVARAVDVLQRAHVPIANTALHAYIIDGLRLSVRELQVIQTLAEQGQLTPHTNPGDLRIYKGVPGMVIKKRGGRGFKLGREGNALKEKLIRITGQKRK